MGRQKGDGNRSKARPSSSSLAASLVPSGSTAVGFGGFVGSSRVDSALSTDDSVPFLDIDGEVAQHLKRLARKDPTTKVTVQLHVMIIIIIFVSTFVEVWLVTSFET
ncbi:E3 ubiquitin-protein ligase listerin-like [Camellia sinensis]|uniref:E3 ubiquitin-protein ligase listerin-like n=1 Tax=Camellia sinensis TaxID=4442 RepID=UPI00103556AE|nr:E3 ubiquitin-protein ligase listerin-like [Camellia sinensis]